MWSIEEERKQAQDFAFRASILEDIGALDQAETFHQLVALSDRKIELFKALDESRQIFTHLRDNPNRQT